MSHGKKKKFTDLHLYFIFMEANEDGKVKNEDVTSDENMKLAFQECEEAGLSPQWVAEAECKKMVRGKHNVFVLDKFEGEVFNTLCRFKSRIVGPKCVQSYIAQGLPLPEARSPVFNMAMRNLVITGTALPTDKKVEIKKLVGYMGGHYVNKFVKSVTHMVTNVAGSAKYQKACEQGIPVMIEEWIRAVWNASLVRDVKATDSEFDVYKCPIFFDMRITCSKLTREEKEHLTELITKHGGICTPNLRQQETTVVILKEPFGKKYRFARAWGLPCVHPSWIFESVEKGYAVSIDKHLVIPHLISELKSPTLIREPSPNISSDADGASSVSVDSLDTSRDKTDTSECDVYSVSDSQQIIGINDDDSVIIHGSSASSGSKEYHKLNVDITRNISHKTHHTSDLFQGLVFFLSNLNKKTEETMFSLITSCGGTVVTKCSDCIVHYAVVPLEGITEGPVIALKALEVVTELWVADCLEAAKVLPVHYYHQPMKTRVEEKKPLKGCCISFSSYVGSEKVFISKLAEHLGAVCQDVFVTQNNEAKGEVMSTHLVCSVPSGDKYSAAVKCEVPVVTEEWLLACAKHGTKVDEQLYFPEIYEDSWSTCVKLSGTQCLSPVSIPQTPVAVSREPSKLEDCSPQMVTGKPMTSSEQTQCIMPQTSVKASVGSSDTRTLLLETVKLKTSSGLAIPQIIVASPMETSSRKLSVNCRMFVASNLSPPPRSPFHVSTPDSPYGQVFRTPTDSSKKRWKKWIESFPDYRCMHSFPCSTQQRKNSTPYSELKKHVFERFLDMKYDPEVNIDPITGDIVMDTEDISCKIENASDVSFCEEVSTNPGLSSRHQCTVLSS